MLKLSSFKNAMFLAFLFTSIKFIFARCYHNSARAKSRCHCITDDWYFNRQC